MKHDLQTLFMCEFFCTLNYKINTIYLQLALNLLRYFRMNKSNQQITVLNIYVLDKIKRVKVIMR